MITQGSLQFFWYSAVCVLLLFVAAYYCITVSSNLIRILIGIEVFAKAVTLLIIAAGFVTGKTALSQALVITLILVEVVIIAVAAGLVIGAYDKTGSLDAKDLRNLKG